MKRIKMTIAYDGTRYSGWQIQPNAATVEGVLTDALSSLLHEPVALIGASRTDAGVHALGNVAVFDTEHPIPAEKISYAVNAYLPEDIRVVESRQVAGDFHPRYDCHSKCYEYHITCGEFAMPMERLYAHHLRKKPDVARMQAAAVYVEGSHDFTSFCQTGTPVRDKVRTIYSLTVCDREQEIVIRVVGNGFLYNMVRIIAGTLIQVGLGEKNPEDIPAIIEAMDRQKAGHTAPAKGLRLCYIRYED